MKINLVGDYFVATEIEPHHIPLLKKAGWMWDAPAQAFLTKLASLANKFGQYASDEAKVKIVAKLKTEFESISLSRALDAELDIPAPDGSEYLPFQKAGIKYMLQRPCTLLADQMGLGKTIESLGFINYDKTIKSILVIASGSVRSIWVREMAKWLTRDFTLALAEVSMEADIVVTHYDALRSHNVYGDDGKPVLVVNPETHKAETLQADSPIMEAIMARHWDLLIVDESHKIKNLESKQSLAVRKIGAQVERIISATGTPIMNRPFELYPQMLLLRPDDARLTDKAYFIKNFCGGKERGAGTPDQLRELQRLLRRTVMIRRLKSEVLKDLPEKMRQIVEISATDEKTRRVIEAHNVIEQTYMDTVDELKGNIYHHKSTDNWGSYRKACKDLGEYQKQMMGVLAKIRHEVALLKAPAVIEHIDNMLEEVDKVLVFAHHKDVIDALYTAFMGKALVIDGRVPQKKRQAIVDAFQEDPRWKVLIGGITVAGEGYNLTASHNVVMAELDWSPGSVSQCEDRAHRIGQKESVLVQHMVFEKSIEIRLIELIVEKQEIIDHATNVEDEFAMAAAG